MIETEMELAGNVATTIKKKRLILMTARVTAFAYVTFILLSALSLVHLLFVIQPFNITYVARYPDHHYQLNNSKQNLMFSWASQVVHPQIICDRTHYHYDLCQITGPNILKPILSTFYTLGPTKPKHLSVKIRPYPRKWENFTMSKIKEIKLVLSPIGGKCDIVHNSHAIVFSAGGYTGNFFHEFNEGFLPLFITVRSLSIPDRDVVLVIQNVREWWITKYIDLLHAFTKHPIVNLDNDTSIHCFTSTTLGLISHGFMTINPKLMPNSTTLTHFHDFLNKAYTQAHKPIIEAQMGRPKLVLVTRIGDVGRVMINEAQVKKLAEKVGFDVVIFEPRPNIPLSETYKVMNESHVMVGVHGAAMTHLLFLRPGSVFIQVVPIGTDFVAELCYGKPAKEMGLEYLEYKVRVEESSLSLKYGTIDPILKDPMTLQNKGWSFLKKVYLKEQDVKLDLGRFRGYLKRAYRKANKLMLKV